MRFPQLAGTLYRDIDEIEKSGKAISDTTTGEALVTILSAIFPFWEIKTARAGPFTVRENGMLLHSAYDPLREAQNTVLQAQNTKTTDITAAVFFGFGIGYLPNAYAASYPGHTLILVEPEIRHFLAALALLDWTPVLQNRECILAVNCSPETVLPLIEKTGLNHCTFFSLTSQTEHAKAYFDSASVLIERNRQKTDINTNTLERFSGLWLRNSCRNISSFAELDGIHIYQGHAQNIPAVVLAAGPSLEIILPGLAEIKKRAIIICVDTALRACLRSGIEPDFIILVDPQYWAARHIAGLSSPSSVLITESAVYPPVYRFPCRKTVLCSSLFPLGQYFEKQLGLKGKLAAGGSVSTTAWDFARFIGSDRIYMAGLDLGYPGKKTHITGSTFEESVHAASVRTQTAETAGVRSLFDAPTEYGSDNNGNRILTDSRMKLFAWWFESRLATRNAPATFTFSAGGLHIPGIDYCPLQTFLDMPPIGKLRESFFECSEHACRRPSDLTEKFLQTCRQLSVSFHELYQLAQKGEQLCNRAISRSGTDYPAVINKLSEIDTAITESGIKDIVSLVFPTEKQLAGIMAKEYIPAEPYRATFYRSKIIYREIISAISAYITNFSFSSKLLCPGSDINSMQNGSTVDGNDIQTPTVE
jgi:hypothetical protein